MTVQDSKMLPPAEPKALPAAGESQGGGGGGAGSSDGGSQAPKRKGIVSLLVWVVVLGGLGVLGWYGWKFYENSKKPTGKKGQGDAAVPVVVEKATVGSMNIFIKRIGTVNAYNTVTLRTRVDGELDKVLFTEGQLVKAGAVLFQIDPRPYQVQLEQAEGQLAKDQATLDNDKVNLKRYTDAGDSVAKIQRDTAQASVHSDEGVVKADQGAIDSARLNITYCTILAPISGRIGLRMVDQGNMVHASDANGLAVIAQLQPISVIFSPAQDELPAIQKAIATGKPVLVEAWDSLDQAKIATGKLAALDNQIDPTTGTVKIRADFANEDNALYPQQFVNAHLLVDQLKGVVMVPDAAVQTDANNKPFVYVAKADNTVEVRPVTLGASQDQMTVIEKAAKPGEGVKEGEEVVTAGVDKLKDKSKVVPHEAGESETEPAATGASTKAAASAGGKAVGGRGRGRLGTGGAATRSSGTGAAAEHAGQDGSATTEGESPDGSGKSGGGQQKP